MTDMSRYYIINIEYCMIYLDTPCELVLNERGDQV